MVRGKTSAPRRKIPSALSSKQGALAGKRAADDRALALLPTIRELIAAGFASDGGLTNELNRKGITGARGGRWHRSSMRRLLTRLRQLTSKHKQVQRLPIEVRGRRRGGSRGALAHKHAANMRARALSAVVQDIRAAGFISYNAVARELNRRGVPTLRHGKQWYPTTVSRLLVRLAKMRS